MGIRVEHAAWCRPDSLKIYPGVLALWCSSLQKFSVSSQWAVPHDHDHACVLQAWHARKTLRQLLDDLEEQQATKHEQCQHQQEQPQRLGKYEGADSPSTESQTLAQQGREEAAKASAGGKGEEKGKLQGSPKAAAVTIH